ncbi:MAG: hypothetical protein ACE5IG_05030 [Dehalococcoidia bacterium]
MRTSKLQVSVVKLALYHHASTWTSSPEESQRVEMSVLLERRGHSVVVRAVLDPVMELAGTERRGFRYALKDAIARQFALEPTQVYLDGAVPDR